jgi:N-acetylgalactosamine PTS system EIIA component
MSDKGSRGSGGTGRGAKAVRAIIAGHGDFSSGLVSAIQQITGRGDEFRALSARDLSAADLEALIERAIAETGAQVVFTDLQAGSCTMAVRRLARVRPDVLIIAGANLPMLLDFVFADQMPPVEAAKHALERGKAAITSISGGKRP